MLSTLYWTISVCLVLFAISGGTEPAAIRESCNAIEGYSGSQHYRIVDNCHGGNRIANESVIERCEQTSWSVLGRIPVSNLDTGVTFQNIYCAICHGQYSAIKRWAMKIHCRNNGNVEKLNANITGDCKEIVLKPDIVALRKCTTSRVVRRKRVTVQESADVESMALGYTTLLNFGVDGSEHTLYTSDATKFLSESACSKTQIYNPFTQECIETQCPSTHVSVKGHCVGQRVVSRQTSTACVEFNLRYRLEEKLPEHYKKEFIETIVRQMFGKYNVSTQNVLRPTMPYSLEGQCNDVDSYQSSHLSYNANSLSNTTNSSPIPQISQSEGFTCADDSNMTSQHVRNLTISLQFSNLQSDFPDIHSMLTEIQNQRLNVSSFDITNANETFSGYGCVMSAKLYDLGISWCLGFQNNYFNDEFEVLTTGHEAKEKVIIGIKVFTTNRTYTVSQFQYTTVLGSGNFWRNITHMASTCDELPLIKQKQGCIRVPLAPHEYSFLPNRSIRVEQFEELSAITMPYDREPRPPIKSVFNLSEYEYIWNDTETVPEINSLDSLLMNQTASICIPEDLLSLYLELEVLKLMNVKHSCAFLQTFGWGSSITGFIFSGISFLAMVLVLATYSIFKTLRTLPGVSLMNLTISVMLSQITIFTGLLIPTTLADENFTCFTTAVLTHYCTLCSFMWMNVMAYSSYRAFGANFKTRLSQLNRKHLLFNNLYGWGLPAIIVLTCAIIDYTLRDRELIAYGIVSNVRAVVEKNVTTGQIDKIQFRYRTTATCWIGNSKAALAIFGAPLCYSMAVNLILFIRTCIGMREKKGGGPKPVLRRDSGSGHVKKRNEMAIHLRLSAQYGFAWIFAIIIILIGTSRSESTAICYVLYIINLIFNILNGCTGLFIFFAFIFNKRILHLYKSKISQNRSKHRSATPTNSRVSSAATLT